jgi:hypothetical protein
MLSEVNVAVSKVKDGITKALVWSNRNVKLGDSSPVTAASKADELQYGTTVAEAWSSSNANNENPANNRRNKVVFTIDFLVARLKKNCALIFDIKS